MTKKIISLFVCLALLFSSIPMMTASAAQASNFERTVDANTMDIWKNYFDLENPDTTNAGGVWTDKSVFSNANAFSNYNITMKDGDKNFLTALSAIAANKQVVGYSTTPTDTVLILDVSGSMDGNQQNLVTAANNAIISLLGINKNNRIGVVLYSASGSFGSSSYGESVTRILSIDRYTTTNANGNYLYLDGETIKVANGVSGENTSNLKANKSFGGGTYIQAGLWEAMKMFTSVEDTVIGPNNWQSGEQRMPIVVLMSDGAPTTGTSFYDDVENSHYTTGNNNNKRTVYKSNVGNGGDSGITEGQAFLTQLTASYIINRIKNHYKAEDGTVRGFFYTLGFNIGNNANALSVMNPDYSTLTDRLWSTYNSLTSGTMEVRVKGIGQQTSYTDVSISKNSYVTNKSYVNEYFSASDNGLVTAFQEIVDEIILQSRYYPTHLEGGSPDFSGYITFEDQIGDYMEVKDIKGIVFGDTLFDGHMMASKLSDTSEDGLGTTDRPTALGDEFIRSVKTRLGIATTNEAHILVSKAWNAKQLHYTNANNWSNYIGWYAKADGTYLGFWDEKSTDPAPVGAVYKIKSYGFLGETAGSIKNSDMMYMSVQVRTDIATGKQTLSWKIPASLVPLITYLVTLKGNSINTATDVSVTVEDKKVSPIRLVFETGLRSDLNEFNITRITDAEHIDSDGHTRLFWNNYFDIDPNLSHDKHITTKSEFTPSKENERFYYTADSVLYKKTGENSYAKVSQGELVKGGEYYHRRYTFNSKSDMPIFTYEKVSDITLDIALSNGWQNDFEVTATDKGAYIVPKDTVARELTPYDKKKADFGAATKSAEMVFHPYITNQNEIAYVDMNLGNNGLLRVVPEQGIKISKTVDVFENGTNDTFKFRINANAPAATYNGYITDLDVTPTGNPINVKFTNGSFEIELKKDQTFWLTGLPAGTTYTVEEISTNEDYKIKSVHVNGVSTGTVANGTVAAYLIDDVDFVNTAMGEGDIVITKQVVDANGNTVDIANSVKFTAEATFTTASGAPLSGTFSANNTAGSVTITNGKLNVTLAEGESLIIHGIPEKTKYSVTETNIPAGFTFNSAASSMSGVIDSAENDRALIVNTYSPTAVNGNNINVVVNKEISGNRTNWVNGESYSFSLVRLDVAKATSTVIANKTISYSDAVKSFTVSLANQPFTTQGSYYYEIREAAGTQGGITYDTAVRRFRVDVADSDKDGDLEIVNVVNEALTTVTGSYIVSASFNNIYSPTESAHITIPVKKQMVNENNQPSSYPLNGFQFALYDNADIDNATEIVRSTVTDAHGNAQFDLAYAANRVGETYTYYIAEINTGNPNIEYTTAVYEAKITVTDNGDGTTTATSQITLVGGQGVSTPTFTNIYKPSKEAYVTISGTKTIKGDRILNSNEFGFILAPVTQGAPMPSSSIAKNTANGSFVFGAIKFDETLVPAGSTITYNYTLKEDQSKKIGGFEYDNKVYNIAIKATNQNAVITTEVIIDNGAVTDIVFENKYTPTPTKVSLNGTKILTGKTLESGEFEFIISRVTPDAPMPFANTNTNSTTNDDKGFINFGTLTFSKKGVYVYNIYEADKNDDRYDCDKSVYTVTINVIDDSEGTLTPQIVITKDNVSSSEIVFRNGFVPAPIEYDIYAKFGGLKKLVNNVNREIKEGEFEFVLINAINGKQIGEAVKNDQNGSFKFPAVVLPEAGVYHYKINEIAGNQKGVAYDTSSFHVVLKVEQSTNGTLQVVANSDKLYKGTVTKEYVNGILTEVTHYDLASTIEFNNLYAADPVNIQIGGIKKLEGKALEAEEFTFNLYADLNDEAIDTAKNNADGSFKFKEIEISNPGVYTYFVTEDATNPKENITYDATVYKIVATATDNLDGTMSVVFTYETDDGAKDEITFLNTYSEPPAPQDPPQEPTPPTPPKAPQTGDTQNLWMWIALAFVSVIGFFATTRRRKKAN